MNLNPWAPSACVGIGARTRTRAIALVLRVGLAGLTSLGIGPLGDVCRAEIVLEWNRAGCDAIRAQNAAPTHGSRTLAMLHLAIYDAVNSLTRTHEPYRFAVAAEPGALPEAAALAAGYHVLTVLCPTERAVFEGLYARTLANLPSGPDRDEGLRVGREVALRMLEWRNADGSSTDVPYIPSDAPGAWRRTPPEFRPPLAPNWGRVQPFGIPGVEAFPLPPPPALDSLAYRRAFEQLQQWGSKQPRSRTAEETEIGLFWAYDRGGMGPPPILYNQMAGEVARIQGQGLAENARLFALLNLAQADAGIVCWAIKYQYNFWRPITAIREGDSDGNPDTLAEPDWQPLGAPGSGVRPDFTPPFPSYPSGHASFGGAVFRILERFLGTDDIPFACGSDELPGVLRTYRTLSQADEENALSRIYLGVHWNFDQREGQGSGRAVAEYIFQTMLQPLPEAGSPRLSPPVQLPDGRLALHVAAQVEESVALQASADLRTWYVIASHTGPFTVIESAASAGARFYRAGLSPASTP